MLRTVARTLDVICGSTDALRFMFTARVGIGGGGGSPGLGRLPSLTGRRRRLTPLAICSRVVLAHPRALLSTVWMTTQDVSALRASRMNGVLGGSTAMESN